MKAVQDHLPTLVGLARRNIVSESVECKLCGEGEETNDHLFSGCYIAMGILDFISHWCGIPNIYAFSGKDLIMAHTEAYMDNKKNKAVQAIIFTVVWCLWKSRNEAMFDNKDVNAAKIKQEIKALGYLWIKNRSCCKTITWIDWCNFTL
ncbi:uncharacterized protein LOC110913778 [Helianthus annuus]|uniref:uncharacterized protein LOC110913778 n=1 Tax=Helianthus annuus TaxID=4232 RepID=UPI000B8FC147|nr:uncharacterized protein LOC110913778 [Helianthus annuus]KAJ0473180.1 putative reverse transcriptase zinc-binding domain-containing protein [Helianthus annuus]